jgi:hypothetical protein
MIVFGFSAAGDPSVMMQTEVSKVIQASMHTTDCLTFNEEDNEHTTSTQKVHHGPPKQKLFNFDVLNWPL